jgi:hypothetical protein
MEAIEDNSNAMAMGENSTMAAETNYTGNGTAYVNGTLYVVEMPELMQCPPLDTFPTIVEFNAALGVYASVLYVSSAVIVVVLALQYGFLIGKFNKHVPNQRKVNYISI